MQSSQLVVLPFEPFDLFEQGFGQLEFLGFRCHWCGSVSLVDWVQRAHRNTTSTNCILWPLVVIRLFVQHRVMHILFQNLAGLAVKRLMMVWDVLRHWVHI